MKENNAYGHAKATPPPIYMNGSKEYKVEAMLKEQKWKGQQQYLIKWKGYPLSECTWELADNLHNVQEAIQKYNQTKQRL